uniref:DNA pilot protein n=1 Tax=Dulem virus 108 TaxID=3145585 RepID=A0AAU8AXX7_9VIRU
MALGAIIAGGASLLGSALGFGSQKKTNKANMELAKYQNEWQAQENEKAYQRNLQMWNLQNAYNSPTQQMARLRSAGLNPNLVYGSGVTGNSAGSTPQYQPADIKRAELSPYRGWNQGLTDAVSNFLAFRSNRAQVENMEAQNSLIRQQTATEATRQANIAASTARSEFDLTQANRLKDVSVSMAEAQMSKAQHDASTAWSQSQQSWIKTNIDRALQETRIKITKEEYNSLVQATRRLLQDNDINAFRNVMERMYGRSGSSLGIMRDFGSRMLHLLLGDGSFDKLFNPNKY